MIADPQVLSDVRQSWQGVRALQERIKTATVVTFAGGTGLGGLAGRNLAIIAHNLPFLQACSVLNDALEQLSKEGRIKCSSRFLGALVNASKSAIPWIDHQIFAVEIVSKRNELAHKATVLSLEDCLRYIDNIENELKAWNIL